MVSHCTLNNSTLLAGFFRNNQNPIPISIVSYCRIRHRGTDASQGTDEPEYLTSQVAQGETSVEGIVYKDGCLDHHEEVADREVHDEHVRGCP